ncbi:MAG: crossover junction endodeoxyribonuclease RuvC [Candidatus Nitrospinota bacterium M3_3B_026]
MIVIGVDPGTLATGYGIVSETRGGAPRFHGCGVIRAKRGASMPHRMKTIADGLREVIGKTGPEFLALEKSFFAMDPQSALKLGHARGVIMLVAETMGLPVAEYSPNAVKQAVAGYGKADKAQVREMVKRLLSMDEPPSSYDASDALAIAITHLSHARLDRLKAR